MIFLNRKFIFQLILYVVIFSRVFTNFAMEQDFSGIPELPAELGSIIAEFAKLSTRHVITLKQNGTQPGKYYILIPEFSHKYHLKKGFGYCNRRGIDRPSNSPSCNLNSLDIVIIKNPFYRREGTYRFSQSCWFGGRQYGNLGYSDYRYYYKINDHSKKRRDFKYNYSISYEPTLLHFFDGFNDNDIFLIIENYVNRPDSPKSYNLRLGKMTDIHTEAYKSNKRRPDKLDRPNPKENALFDYESNNNRGNVSAFALCKTVNRFVFIDNKRKIKACDITESSHNALTVSNITGTVPTSIKKISFITPTTLLALSEKGKVFIISADPGKPIKFFKQRFRKNGISPLLFSHFAVDPCNPYQVLLLSKDNQCIYWDLIHKQLVPLMKIEDEVQSLWFYNHTFGYLDTKNNFKKYHLKYITTENKMFSALLENCASSVTIARFNKKNKKLHNFVKSLITTTAIITGLASLYLYKNSFSFDFEKLPSFFNKINNNSIFKFLYTKSI